MAPMVLADSDDDGDTEDLVSTARRETTAMDFEDSNGKLDVGQFGLDGTNEKSTGSTERLRRQIESAERGLCLNSAPKTALSQPSPFSPLHIASKRRHTDVAGGQCDTPSAKGVKRMKTLKTYSKRSFSASMEVLDPDSNSYEAQNADTAESFHISETSRLNLPNGLPTASIQQDFLNHEPAVLFRDTGSTVEDTSSVQQRLLDQAWYGNENLESPAGAQQPSAKASSLQDGDSSFPWSVSTKENSDQADGAPKDDDGTAEPSIQSDTPLRSNREVAESPSNVSHRGTPSVAADGQNERSIQIPHNSPIVEIPWQSAADLQPLEPSPEPMSKRSRKRKAETSYKEPTPESDDDVLVAIGLSKEMYKPRPSRRRATQPAEDPSADPLRSEKSARVKRHKSTGAQAECLSHEIKDDATSPVPQRHKSNPAQVNDAKPHDDAEPRPSQPHDEQITVQRSDPDAAARQSQGATKNTATSSMGPDDEIFVKPAKPAAKVKKEVKSRRSKTTIFEDHLAFSEKERSPSLSQQQASRKLALQDIQNDSGVSSQRKRKRIIHDEDDEDEDVKHIEQDDQPASKKRLATTKATKREERDSEVEEEEDQLLQSNNTSKKRKRDVGTKDTSPLPADPSAESTSPPRPSSYPHSLPSPPDPQNPTVGTPEMTTTTKEPAARKSPPTQHSPLKSSSKVPLRVGLNKRQRIPPLLRVINVPKKR